MILLPSAKLTFYCILNYLSLVLNTCMVFSINSSLAMIFQNIIHKFSFSIVKKLKANKHFYQSSHGSIKLAKAHRQLKINMN